MPHGYVGLQYSTTRLAICEQQLRRHRILFWRKRWVNVTLAETSHKAKIGEVIELDQRGRIYTITVEGKPVLTWLRPA